MVNSPLGWLTIDPQNGIITAVKQLDRESSSIVNSTYKAIVLAVDNGKPGSLLWEQFGSGCKDPSPPPSLPFVQQPRKSSGQHTLQSGAGKGRIVRPAQCPQPYWDGEGSYSLQSEQGHNSELQA